jgi:hypothetical protein
MSAIIQIKVDITSHIRKYPLSVMMLNFDQMVNQNIGLWTWMIGVPKLRTMVASQVNIKLRLTAGFREGSVVSFPVISLLHDGAQTI